MWCGVWDWRGGKVPPRHTSQSSDATSCVWSYGRHTEIYKGGEPLLAARTEHLGVRGADAASDDTAISMSMLRCRNRKGVLAFRERERAVAFRERACGERERA